MDIMIKFVHSFVYTSYVIDNERSICLRRAYYILLDRITELGMTSKFRQPFPVERRGAADIGIEAT